MSKPQWLGTRVAVLAVGEAAVGGADRFYTALCNGLVELGCDTTIIRVPGSESSFEEILQNYEYCRDLNLSEYDVVISTKAPSFVVKHRRHIVYLVHTVRVFDDMFESNFKFKSEDVFRQRKILHDFDFSGLRCAKALFCIGGEVKRRLTRKYGLEAAVLHPPLGKTEFRNSGDSGSFLFPGRLHPWKRVDLAIAAMKELPTDIRLDIVGHGEDEMRLRELAREDERIRFLGSVSDEELVELYASCRAVLFTPAREDYGYVTLEAFASGKPVITCRDSGETTHFVRHGETGLVVDPSARSLAEAMGALAREPERARRMGETGRASIASMSWSKTCETLLSAAYGQDRMPQGRSTRVCVLDMQPIDPPVGGGRLRLLGLYHGLGENIDATYVGTYDWPGERRREVKHSDTLTEITVPLSSAHHDVAAAYAEQAGGKTVIDLAFSELVHLSPEFAEAARSAIEAAQVVVFSHPWVYPLVAELLRPDQLVIYDSHNVEVFLRRQILEVSNPFERRLLEAVARDEYAVISAADLVLACSHEDAKRFHRIYDVAFDRLRVVPNGVMAQARHPADEGGHRAARAALSLGEHLVAIFVGSAYGPNIEAARFIVEDLAPLLRDVTFVIAGGVGESVAAVGPNVRVTGPLSAEGLGHYLAAADCALNPMFSGSGTNIKMFDFMACGLPTITTATGARGIQIGGEQAFLIVEGTPQAFAAQIETLKERGERVRIGAAARRAVERSYAWEVISRNTGALMTNWLAGQMQRKPLFSVVVPTYERSYQLVRLLERLAEQIEVDFEVVVVDQSTERFADAKRAFGYELTYLHSPVRGAVYARNLGAFVAKGQIIAFVDDDCIPDPNWLVNARNYFADPEVVAVEGMIYSDRLGDPDWRPVTNVGFEGIGFMSANLLVRQAAFQQVGGFDIQFDHPHFREDTDLGWRLQDIGRIPYADDVSVFHPAQPRTVERESRSSRTRFFEKDVLLYRKHPHKFKYLFFLEQQWTHTPEYREILSDSFRAAGIERPQWIPW